VHRDGLALTVSLAKRLSDGTLVHETRVLIDDDADRSLDDLDKDLREFLMAAVPDAVLREIDGSFAMEVDYFELPRLCELVRAHADARTLPGWDSALMQLRDVTDATSRLAIMMLGTWSVDPGLFPNLAFYIDSAKDPVDMDSAKRVQDRAQVTVVLDTARGTVVATVSGSATELWLDEEMIGLGGFTADAVEIEVRERLVRQEAFPEIVLGQAISMVLDPSGARFSDAPFWLEGMGYRRADDVN
jgi:hypothetical protein